MNAWTRIPLQLGALALIGIIWFVTAVTGAFYYAEPSLPTAEELRENVVIQIPSRVYSRDGRLMQQYGEQFRTPADIEEIPLRLRQAVIAAEDDRFYEHSGIDIISTIRAVMNYGLSFVLPADGRVAGGSTITQQITRTTDLLDRDYAVGRKVKEIFLAFRIEEEFTKDEILELYLNTYFFGQRSYGVVSAARRYFDKRLNELTLSEMAIIAGIPTRPSSNNPYTSPENAGRRRGYVLRRMTELGFIEQAEREAALEQPIYSQLFDVETELSADYVAAMAYEWCQQRFGKLVCDTAGLRIMTTVDSRLQRAANAALRDALEAYDRNHGYRGPIARVDLEVLLEDAEGGRLEILRELLSEYQFAFNSEPAVVLAANEIFADVYLRSVGQITIGLDAVAWARQYINDDIQGARPQTVDAVLTPGDVVRMRRLPDGRLELFQAPDVEGAFVSVDPKDNAIVSLVGGYDFGRQSYNRATAPRQPGSSIKPFFYLGALASGYTLADIVNDAPLVSCDEGLEECRPVRNYDGRYEGDVSIRYALTRSINTVADRVIRDIKPRAVIPTLERFGFSEDALPNNASLALGSGSVTPVELAGAYAMLANGGYATGIVNPDTGRPAPWFIERVEDADGNVLYDASQSVEHIYHNETVEDETLAESDGLINRPSELYPPLRRAERAVAAQLIYLITDVMQDVVRRGSGARAGRAFPDRRDLAGKTGTTSGPRDAWFSGFNADIVAVVRVGFDVGTRDLGGNEQGGVTAIPAWIDYMQVALAGMPDRTLPRPAGIVDRRVNAETGQVAADCNRDADWEMFLADNVPERESDIRCLSGAPLPTETETRPGPDPIFD